jgi:phosphoribosylamine--glycine ligase
MMLTAEGPKVIEYNVRFGDPECQVVLPRITSDFAELLLAAAAGGPLDVAFSGDACVTVVLASEGYPASGRTGDVITGLDVASAVNEVTVFHAGTARDPAGVLRTAGGRVLDVTACGPTLGVARTRAYEAAGLISWPGMQFRRDIAGAVASALGDGSAPRR